MVLIENDYHLYYCEEISMLQTKSKKGRNFIALF